MPQILPLFHGSSRKDNLIIKQSVFVDYNPELSSTDLGVPTTTATEPTGRRASALQTGLGASPRNQITIFSLIILNCQLQI